MNNDLSSLKKVDEAIFNLVDILENGKPEYKLVTTEKELFVIGDFRILENNNYLLTFTLKPEQHNKGIDVDYFMTKPFILLTRDGMKIVVNNYKIVKASKGIIETVPCKFQIEIKSFRGDADESLWLQSKQKAYIKYKRNNFSPCKSGIVFDYTTSGKDNGFYNALILKIDNTEIIFYHESLSMDSGYFVIAHNQKIDFEKFQSIVSSIITAYGFLNGFYMLDTIYYFSVKEIENVPNVTFYYENFNQAIFSENPILDSGNYHDIPKEKRLLSSNQFNKLVNIFLKDADYMRSGYLLIEAGSLNGSSKASLGAVALETVTKKIVAKKLEDKIVEDKNIMYGLLYKLKKILKEYSNVLTKEQLLILTNKLNAVNKKPNSSKLNGAFDDLSISLTAEEKQCIDSRNLFLHGSLPRNKEGNLTDQEQVNIMANRLVMLTSILLLKLIGYEGYVIDKGMTEIIKWRRIMSGQKAPKGNYLREITQKEN